MNQIIQNKNDETKNTNKKFLTVYRGLDMSRKALSALFVSILLSMLLPSLSSALGTPDGLPPSMETICDSKQGAAYGLCNAYCEAMDCDDPAPHASVTACQKVSDKFTQLTGEQLPCDDICPLNDAEDYPYFFGVVNGDILLNECARDSNWIDSITGVAVWSTTYTPEPDAVAGAVWITGPGRYSGGDGQRSTIDLDVDQYHSCLGLLETAIASTSGLTCNGE
jgi:hypothetical protein